jgi:hypothetical protein
MFSRSVIDDTRNLTNKSRSVDDNSRSVKDDSRVMLQLVASFMTIVYL